MERPCATGNATEGAGIIITMTIADTSLEERTTMTLDKTLRSSLWLLAALLLSVPVSAQTDRGTAQLDTADGSIVVDYGRPQLKGRDPLNWQKDGTYWRMGMNDLTTLRTPADLVFGSVKVPKGTYGLSLLKVSPEHYELVFNSQTSGMGMSHDKEKDVASVPLRKESVPDSVETFTIELKGGASGGVFALLWGTTRLAADFHVTK
jgi:Protein of unknown function (DUF2911)